MLCPGLQRAKAAIIKGMSSQTKHGTAAAHLHAPANSADPRQNILFFMSNKRPDSSQTKSWFENLLGGNGIGSSRITLCGQLTDDTHLANAGDELDHWLMYNADVMRVVSAFDEAACER